MSMPQSSDAIKTASVTIAQGSVAPIASSGSVVPALPISAPVMPVSAPAAPVEAAVASVSAPAAPVEAAAAPVAAPAAPVEAAAAPVEAAAAPVEAAAAPVEAATASADAPTASALPSATATPVIINPASTEKATEIPVESVPFVARLEPVPARASGSGPFLVRSASTIQPSAGASDLDDDLGWAVGDELEFLEESDSDWDGPTGDGLDEEVIVGRVGPR